MSATNGDHTHGGDAPSQESPSPWTPVLQGPSHGPPVNQRALDQVPTLPPDDPSRGRLGEGLVAVGALTLLALAVANRSGGGIAAALFVVITGVILRFPSTLEDGTKTEAGVPAVSAMRVAVLTIVMVFALLTVRVGWSTTTLEALKVDPSWAWVLATALGSKVVQRIAEAVDNSRNASKP